MVLYAPSILSADFARLGQEVRAVEEAGADRIHVDVMDGHFVPNLTVGPLVVRCLRPVTRLPLFAHLMIEQPEHFLEPFAKAGADAILVHVEACTHLHRVIAEIHDLGCRAGVALNPATPLETLQEILPDLDEVLIMSVDPGFGGQAFIPRSLDKIARLRRLLDERGLAHIDISVDGGIDVATGPQVVRAGANVLVAGAAIFEAPEGPAAALEQLKKAVAAAG
ncbi:MAG: ribulose-phosphate 3-epimerase [Chloroflexia bacterium]